MKRLQDGCRTVAGLQDGSRTEVAGTLLKQEGARVTLAVSPLYIG